MRLHAFVALMCALPIAACDDDDKPAATDTSDTVGDTAPGDTTPGDTTPGDTSPNPTGVEDQLAKAYCDYLEQCYPFDTSEGLLVLLAKRASDATCETFVKRAILAPEGRDAGLASGALTLDSDKLAACLAAIPTACGANDPGTLCQEAIEGKVALGGACASSFECAGDAYCDAALTGCPTGTCIARGGPGAACDSSDACSNASARLECSYESSTCVPVEFVEGGAKGAECGEIHATDAIVVVRCAAPFVCTEGSCQEVIASGGTCTSDHSPCVTGTACMPNANGPLPDGGGDTGTCREPPFTATEGAACVTDWEATNPTFCDPVSLLTCVNGKCERIGDGTEGARCLAGIDAPPLCNAGLYCDGATATCRPPQADGATCEGDDECESGLCVWGTEAGRCEPATNCR